MKLSVSLISWFLTASFCLAQSAKEEKPYFTCSADSLVHEMRRSWKQDAHDMLLVAHYASYHEIGDQSGVSAFYIFSKSGNKIKLRSISGCQHVECDTTHYLSDSQVFDFYIQQQLGQMKKPIKSWLSQSHDGGWIVTVFVDGVKQAEINVRNHQFIGKPGEELDERVEWVGMIREIVK